MSLLDICSEILYIDFSFTGRPPCLAPWQLRAHLVVVVPDDEDGPLGCVFHHAGQVDEGASVYVDGGSVDDDCTRHCGRKGRSGTVRWQQLTPLNKYIYIYTHKSSLLVFIGGFLTQNTRLLYVSWCNFFRLQVEMRFGANFRHKVYSMGRLLLLMRSSPFSTWTFSTLREIQYISGCCKTFTIKVFLEVVCPLPYTLGPSFS